MRRPHSDPTGLLDDEQPAGTVVRSGDGNGLVETTRHTREMDPQVRWVDGSRWLGDGGEDHGNECGGRERDGYARAMWNADGEAHGLMIAIARRRSKERPDMSRFG